MREFDYIRSPERLLTPEIVQMTGSIHEHKGRQELFLEAYADQLKPFHDAAIIQSTGASNRIEGIFTSDKRLEELICQKAEPRNHFEQEIAGYRDVLAAIHEKPRIYYCASKCDPAAAQRFIFLLTGAGRRKL